MHRCGQGLRSTLIEHQYRPMTLVFVYGTLCEDIVRDRVLGHHVETMPAVLHGFSKICGGDYLTIVPSNHRVIGQVFDATDDDIARMDVWEEVPEYVLTRVTVDVGGEDVTAYTYIMSDPPENHEVVDDDCISSIPLRSIIRDLDSMFGRL